MIMMTIIIIIIIITRQQLNPSSRPPSLTPCECPRPDPLKLLTESPPDLCLRPLRPSGTPPLPQGLPPVRACSVVSCCTILVSRCHDMLVTNVLSHYTHYAIACISIYTYTNIHIYAIYIHICLYISLFIYIYMQPYIMCIYTYIVICSFMWL